MTDFDRPLMPRLVVARCGGTNVVNWRNIRRRQGVIVTGVGSEAALDGPAKERVGR